MDQKFIIDTPTNDQARLTGQDAKHISRILRAAPGDTLLLTDGRGTDYRGTILEIQKDGVSIKIDQTEPSRTESPLTLTLCNGMLKHQKMESLIPALNQLGVSQWIPFQCRYAISNPDEKRMKKRLDRWQTIVKESLKQCRRSRLMEISSPVSFKGVLDHARDYDHKIAFWESSTTPLSELTPLGKSGETAIILIGPEGGFSAEEMALAEAAGFKTYSLGPRILKAETATLTAASLAQHFLGDL